MIFCWIKINKFFFNLSLNSLCIDFCPAHEETADFEGFLSLKDSNLWFEWPVSAFLFEVKIAFSNSFSVNLPLNCNTSIIWLHSMPKSLWIKLIVNSLIVELLWMFKFLFITLLSLLLNNENFQRSRKHSKKKASFLQ